MTKKPVAPKKPTTKNDKKAPVVKDADLSQISGGGSGGGGHYI